MSRTAIALWLTLTVLACSLTPGFGTPAGRAGGSLELDSGAVDSSAGVNVVDVIDLRGKSLEVRLLVLSLQGIVNRRGPTLYVIWESKHLRPTSSERWLEYYREKGWIQGYRRISLSEAMEKYRDLVDGLVVYDPEVPETINVAVSLASVEGLIVAHPALAQSSILSGLEVKYDLRGMFEDGESAHRWLLDNVFPRCNRSLINLFPTQPSVAIYRVSVIDYVIANGACSIGLSVEKDAELIGEFYERMNKFAVVLGYPEDPALERSWVSLTSRYGLLNVLATGFAPNFSFHSKIPAKREYLQDHASSVELDPEKIYVAFAVSDLGLNSMQDFYYEMWLSEGRGELPISWWLDPIVTDFCPGMVQYYYETRTHNDYFYSAHAGGRIRPSDFPYLKEYLERGRGYLERCSLRVVGFSNHGKKDDRVFQLYSQMLDVEGFAFGFGPEFSEEYWFVGDKVWIVPRFMGDPESAYEAIERYIDSTSRRPLFIIIGIGLWYYPKVSDVLEIAEKLRQRYGDQVVFCRLDELMLAAKQYGKPPSRSEEREGKWHLLAITALLGAVAAAVAIIYLRFRGTEEPGAGYNPEADDNRRGASTISAGDVTTYARGST